MATNDIDTRLEKLAQTLKSIFDALLDTDEGLSYTADPEINQKELIEYENRMRSSGMQKFNSPTYITFLNFYTSEANKEKEAALGALVLYFERENAPKLLKSLDYKVRADEDDDEVVLGVCFEFTTDIAKKFLSKVASEGYSNILISEPKGYINTVSEGIPFKFSEYAMYELVFHLWKEKILAAELTLASAA